MAKKKPAAPVTDSPAAETPASVPAVVDVAPIPSGPTVLVEARSGPYEAAIDAGSSEGDYFVRIGGERYEHVSEHAGRWVYRQS